MTNPPTGRGGLSPESLLRFVTIVTTVAIIGVVVLVALGRSADVVWQIFVVAGAPVVTVLLAQMNQHTKEAKDNTNGRMGQMMEMISDLQTKMVDLAKQVPPPPQE